MGWAKGDLGCAHRIKTLRSWVELCIGFAFSQSNPTGSALAAQIINCMTKSTNCWVQNTNSQAQNCNYRVQNINYWVQSINRKAVFNDRNPAIALYQTQIERSQVKRNEEELECGNEEYPYKFQDCSLLRIDQTVINAWLSRKIRLFSNTMLLYQCNGKRSELSSLAPPEGEPTPTDDLPSKLISAVRKAKGQFTLATPICTTASWGG